MKQKLSLLFIALLAASISSKAQDSPVPLSLDECMAYAMKHNYTVKNTRLDVMIQDAQNKETISAAYPHLNAKGELDYYPNPQRTLIDQGSFNPGAPSKLIPVSFTLPFAGTGSITATQTLFDGSILVALQAQKTILDYARLNGEISNETVRYNVYKAYNSLVIAYRQYDIIKKSLLYARQVEHDITVTQQSGFAEKIDVERTSVQVNNLSTDSVKVSNLLTVSEQVLKYQMGMPISTPIILTDTNVEASRTEIASLLDEDEDYSRVPEYNFFNTQLKLNNYNLKRYKYAALPSLSVFGSVGDNYAGYHLSNVTDFGPYLFYSAVGLQLNVPIFNGFMRHNQVREAELNVEKSKNNIDNIKLTIDFQTAQSRTTLKNAILQARSQHANLNLANDVLDLAQRKYKAGVGSNQEVSQAQTDQLQAQNNYFSALLDMINAEADLKKALGLLK